MIQLLISVATIQQRLANLRILSSHEASWMSPEETRHAEIIEKLRENERLRAEVERLRKELEEALRSLKRQAAPFSKGKPKAKPKRPGRRLVPITDTAHSAGFRIAWMKESRCLWQRHVPTAAVE